MPLDPKLFSYMEMYQLQYVIVCIHNNTHIK